MSSWRNGLWRGIADKASRPGCRFPNVYIAKQRGVVTKSTCRTLVTGEAAEALGMERPHFAMLASRLHFEARERRGKRGGKPAKFYARKDVALLGHLFECCAHEGGRAVLHRLLETT